MPTESKKYFEEVLEVVGHSKLFTYWLIKALQNYTEGDLHEYKVKMLFNK